MNQVINNPETQTGFFVVGTLKGYFENQNGQYVNRFIAIVTHTFEDRYGQHQENIEELEVSPKFAQNVKPLAENLTGKVVKIPIGVTHKKGDKNGRHWSFVKYYVRDEKIELIESHVQSSKPSSVKVA